MFNAGFAADQPSLQQSPSSFDNLPIISTCAIDQPSQTTPAHSQSTANNGVGINQQTVSVTEHALSNTGTGTHQQLADTSMASYWEIPSSGSYQSSMSEATTNSQLLQGYSFLSTQSQSNQSSVSFTGRPMKIGWLQTFKDFSCQFY